MPRSDVFAALSGGLVGQGRDTSDYDLNPGTMLPPGRTLRNAAVLIGFQPGRDGLQVILTKRASHLKHHPGQIALPGGKQDDGDRDATATALREAREEIGLRPDQVRVIGALAPHETITGFVITPVLAEIDPLFTPTRQEAEVDEVFRAPYAHVCDPVNFHVESRVWRGVRRHYYTVPYGPYYIWGATARILRALADRVAE